MKTAMTTLISQVAGDERIKLEKSAKVLALYLGECAGRLKSYTDGNDTSVKMLGSIDNLRAVIADFRKQLVACHNLPKFASMFKKPGTF